ncbi:MAG: hypothetical protein KAH38_10060 [Candidatus Hydrogenedentes bacterium]|nr:hypothetical protein [Candidatus Hydrogenedentota bacterium]
MSILDEKLETVQAICQAFHVLKLDAFGPVAGDKFEPSHGAASFLVECEPASQRARYERFFGLLQALEILLGCRIDLVDYRALRDGSIARKIPEVIKPVYVRSTSSESTKFGELS